MGRGAKEGGGQSRGRKKKRQNRKKDGNKAFVSKKEKRTAGRGRECQEKKNVEIACTGANKIIIIMHI